MADMSRDREKREIERRSEEGRNCVTPLSEIREEDGKVLLRLEMPGVSKGDLDIRLDNDELHIKAVRSDRVDENGYFLLRERACADYEKVFTIDDTIDREKVDATMSNGVLFLTLYIKEAVKPRKIDVKAG